MTPEPDCFGSEAEGRLSALTPILQCKLPEDAEDRLAWWRGRKEGQKGQPRSVADRLDDSVGRCWQF